MNQWEIFMIGMFCGAYGMFTLMGLLWCGKREPSSRTVNTRKGKSNGRINYGIVCDAGMSADYRCDSKVDLPDQ